MRRLSTFFIALGCIIAFSSGRAYSATYTVDRYDVDLGDDSPGDGICDTVGGATPDCTIRAAIEEAMANGDASNTINFNSAGPAPVTLAGPLLINTAGKTTNINGIGNALTTINRSAAVQRVFNITDGTATFTRLKISGGNIAGNGGGIQVTGATSVLTLNDCELTNNSSTSSSGGAILVSADANLLLNRSALYSNTADSNGGAIFLTGNGSDLTATNVTFYDNTATSGDGGAIHVANSVLTANLNFVTLSGNSAGDDGGNISVAGTNPTVTFTSSILANGTASDQGVDCLGDVTMSNTNLIENDVDCNTNVTGTKLVTAANLGSFALHGGLTQTIPLNPTSPALDGELIACAVVVDQRSGVRPQDGNFDGTSECDLGAYENTCGDGILDPTETCDDTGTFTKANNGDGCDDNPAGFKPGNCTPTACGNGVQTPDDLDPTHIGFDEQCDDGNTTDGDGCDSNCTNPACGNGVVDNPFENCDDGNTADGDGCNHLCLVEACGNFITEPGEECDDGNTSDSDGCSAICAVEQCGNGVVDPDEDCDDGNGVNGDACENDCTLPSCGNDIIDAGEDCDEGDTVSGDGCNDLCQAEVCGDGVIQSGDPLLEECDGGECCDANCTFDVGASCNSGQGTCNSSGTCVSNDTIKGGCSLNRGDSGPQTGVFLAMILMLGGLAWRRVNHSS